MEIEHEKPVGVLTKAADAMPGFGIVAAVLGIVITMAPSPAPLNKSREGRRRPRRHLPRDFPFLRLHESARRQHEFVNMAETAYIRCIAASVIGFANGMSPIMAVEVARRGLSSELKPSSDALETMLKALNQAPAR